MSSITVFGYVFEADGVTPAGTDTLNGSTASRVLYPGCTCMLYSPAAGAWYFFGG